MRIGSRSRSNTVLLVAPQAPPYGGMALQAQSLQERLSRDAVSAILVPANPDFPYELRFLKRVRGIRGLVRSALFCAQLWRVLPRTNVVHVFACSWLYFFLVVYPAVLITHLNRKRIVLNYRGGEAKLFFRRFSWLLRPAFRIADVVMAPSEFLGELIRTHFQVSVEIVPNILDFSLFPYRERLSIRPNILVARHLEKMYDVESVLRAFRLIQEHHPEASLTIAGTGSQEMRLRSLVSEWNLQHVQFLGHVPHKDLPAIYEQCDVFLNASLVDNFPGALLEASAAGLPIVSTCPGGIPYIYRHEVSALLVEPGNWRGLGNAVIKLLQSQSLVIDLTKAAAIAVRACEWGQVRKALYRCYGFALDREDEPTDSEIEPARSKCVAG